MERCPERAGDRNATKEYAMRKCYGSEKRGLVGRIAGFGFAYRETYAISAKHGLRFCNAACGTTIEHLRRKRVNNLLACLGKILRYAHETEILASVPKSGS
jgi:hypothetical protein